MYKNDGWLLKTSLWVLIEIWGMMKFGFVTACIKEGRGGQ